MKCPVCGTDLSENDLFCPNCGFNPYLDMDDELD